jgi:hypothetical protein
MGKDLRLLVAIGVFVAVAFVALVLMLRFVPSLGADGNETLMALGPLGAILWVVYYGPMLLVSLALGFAFAKYAYSNLPKA